MMATLFDKISEAQEREKWHVHYFVSGEWSTMSYDLSNHTACIVDIFHFALVSYAQITTDLEHEFARNSDSSIPERYTLLKKWTILLLRSHTTG